MPQAKRAIPIKPQKTGPEVGTTYAGRGGNKRLLKARIPAELVDRIDQERAEYDKMSTAHYLAGLITAFYESGLEPIWKKKRTK